MYFQLPTTLLLAICSLTTLSSAQVAAGGGNVAVTAIAASQYPVVTNAPSLVTLNGVTTANQIAFTQLFASTALGTWALGGTPLAGAIGLGDIKGKIGDVKTKRGLEALETPKPKV